MKNMAIMQRILVGLVVIFVLMILIGILAEMMLNKLEEQASEFADRHAPMVDACMEIKLEITTAHLIVEELVGGESDDGSIEDANSLLDNAYWYADVVVNGGTNDEGAFLATDDTALKEKAEELKTLINEFKDSNIERYEAAVSGDYSEDELEEIDEEYDESFENLILVADDMETFVQGKMAEGKIELRRSSKSGSWQIIVMTLCSIIVSVIIAVTIIAKVNKELTNVAKKISQSSSFVASASDQLASSGQQLSSGSAEQAASIEETSATLEETASMVAQNTKNTKRANVRSKDASESATLGSGKMKNMIDSMDTLKKSSEEISKIIKVIDDIAFQTNMLALNAAVEAARAGDAGLGFAVVAEEVRNLAQKSAKAAKDTAEIIDANIESSEQGVRLSEEVNASLEEILTKTDDANKLINEITVASEEQAKGIDQVNTAISQMESVVQQNAAAAEESAASAEELKTQAGTLKEAVFELNVLIQGRNKASEKRKVMQNTRDSVSELDESLEKAEQIVSAEDIIQLDDGDDF